MNIISINIKQFMSSNKNKIRLSVKNCSYCHNYCHRITKTRKNTTSSPTQLAFYVFLCFRYTTLFAKRQLMQNKNINAKFYFGLLLQRPILYFDSFRELRKRLKGYFVLDNINNANKAFTDK